MQFWALWEALTAVFWGQKSLLRMMMVWFWYWCWLVVAGNISLEGCRVGKLKTKRWWGAGESSKRWTNAMREVPSIGMRLCSLPSISVNENGNESGGRVVFSPRCPFSLPFSFTGWGEGRVTITACLPRRGAGGWTSMCCIIRRPGRCYFVIQNSAFDIRHFPFRSDSISVARIMNFECWITNVEGKPPNTEYPAPATLPCAGSGFIFVSFAIKLEAWFTLGSFLYAFAFPRVEQASLLAHCGRIESELIRIFSASAIHIPIPFDTFSISLSSLLQCSVCIWPKFRT